MRLIDADALIDALGISDEDIVFKEILEDAPTIDAVLVVRCKDCKRRKNARKNGRLYWGGYEYYCGIARYGVTDDGFCYYGERKSDD